MVYNQELTTKLHGKLQKYHYCNWKKHSKIIQNHPLLHSILPTLLHTVVKNG